MNSPLELSLQEVLNIAGGRLFNSELALLSSAVGAHYSEFVYDSRKTTPNSIFLCIVGERVDAHDVIDQAVSGGASLVIGSNAQKLEAAAERLKSAQFLCVDDTMLALQKLATFYRRKFSIPVAGLTGSSGKTTTKDLVSAIFKNSAVNGLVTEGTMNNHWGVPQMVLRLRRDHRAAVFEMGMSNFNEIHQLSSICQPDIGYITTIGSAHLENLKSEKGVLKAKRELFDWITQHGTDRLLVFNLDNQHLRELYDEFKSKSSRTLRILTLSATEKSADLRIAKQRTLGVESRFGSEYRFETPWGSIDGVLPLPGAHNLTNALAASAIALATGTVTANQVALGLEKSELSKLRSHLFQNKLGAIVFDDSYNANPTSVQAALGAVRDIRGQASSPLKRTIAVVGDMLELGPNSGDLHVKMGEIAGQSGIDLLLSTGTFAASWASGFNGVVNSGARAFQNQDQLFAVLDEEIRARPEQTLVLVKGSRGAKMEQIVERLKTQC